MGHRFHLRIESAEVDVKILSAVMNVKTLKNTELVSSRGGRGVWNIVLD
jgi:hypothetical protein